MLRACVYIHTMDPDSGSSVTLIYYRIGDRWWKEPFLNVVAAAAQMSSLTHVEIALGEDVGTNGMMTNVCRVFNDKVGVELVERTGRSPHYVYQSLGCSKAAVNRMLRYAKTQCVGKPFSNTGMARSLLWPRQTDGTSFFCAGMLISILDFPSYPPHSWWQTCATLPNPLAFGDLWLPEQCTHLHEPCHWC